MSNDKKQPLVSVIMGIYNTADTLPRAIESILNQTYTNWELIMCDDASTDDTYDVAKQLADKYDNIKLVRNEKNSRLAYSLNQCLKLAQGEYVARMDADDISLPERFEKQVDFLNNHPEYAVVGCGIINFDEDGDRNILIAKECPPVLNMKRGVPYIHPSIMMRKEAYDALGGYYVSERTQKGQDLDLWFRFYAAGFRGYNLQEPLLKYHTSVDDYKKKRKLKYAIGMMKTNFYGFKINRFPLHLYIWAIKPVISSIMPKKIMFDFHKK